MDPATVTTQWLWPNAIGVLPVAAVVWLACRWCIRRPATRHALWVAVLVCLLMPPVLGGVAASLLGAIRIAARPAQPSHAAAHRAETPAAVPAATVQRSPEPARPAMPPIVAETRRDAAPTGHNVASSFAGPRPVAAIETPPATARHDATPARVTAERPEREPLAAPPATAPAPTPAATVPPAMPALVRRPAPAQRSLPAVEPAPVHEPAPAPAAAPPAAPPSWLPQWREWLGHAAEARAWLASAPPLPPLVWLMGAVAVIGAVAFRTLRFRSVVSMAEVAPREVRRLVEDSARELGLREAPAALMVPDRVSPMVWCLGRTRLLLPRELWNELDDGGRRAVVYHELAHLRRRDHWVRWAELAASALFWWHPVLWWVRRKLRDEADLCCDAWVTALLPKQRRAYAQALLCTQVFLSRSDRTAPAVGLGVMSAAAGRLARRLTMVMKERSRPNVSLLGVALAVSLVGAGMTASPLWACPPEEKEKLKLEREALVAAAERARAEGQHAREEALVAAREAMRAQEEGRAARAPKPPRPPKAPKPPKPPKAPKAPRAAVAGEPAAEATTFEEHIRARAEAEVDAARAAGRAGRAAAPRPRSSGDERIDEINRRLDRIERRLEQLIEQRSGQHGPGVLPIELATLGAVALEEGPVVTQVYALPGGKLDAMVELMARDDVPIRISRDDSGIRVLATPHQHEVFRLFVHMIHPEGAAPGSATFTISAPVVADVAALEEVDLDTVALVEAVRAIDGEAEAQEAAAEALEAQMEALEERVGAIEADAEALEEAAEDAEGEQSAAAKARSESLRAEVAKLHEQLTALSRSAERASAEAEAVRTRGEKMKAKVCDKFCGNGKEDACPVCNEHEHDHDHQHDHEHQHGEKAGG